MARRFIYAFLAGLCLTLIAAALWPLPSHERVRSIIDVEPDGGRMETFVVEWPDDLLHMPDQVAGAPAVPELYRLRNTEGVVIGVAGRINPGESPAPPSSGWLLVIPARGALFLGRDAATGESGRLLAGFEEFRGLSGRYEERWEGGGRAPDGSIRGRILISTRSIGEAS